MFGKKIGLVLVAGCLLSSSVAYGSELLGTWQQMDVYGARSVNKGDHNVNVGANYIPGKKKLFTLKIESLSDDKRAFHGQWCSANKCESLVGVVRFDGSLLMVDEDGRFDGILKGETLEMCYSEPGEKFQIVQCSSMKKQ